MLKSSSDRVKGAIFAIVAINVPAEVCARDTDNWSQLWCFDFLLRFSKELGLPEGKVYAYVPMVLTEIPYHTVSCEGRSELVKPYLQILNENAVSVMKAYTHVLMYLIEESLMDGRGRILLRNLSLSLNLSSSDGAWIENMLLQYLVTHQEQINKTKEKKKDKYRYVKIGAVALGAGAVLAVTGGLAAPAVAGAMILMGYSAATAASVAGSMAMLFGGTGAGLAGYKMIKRTRGLSDFEFQSFDAKNRIAVVIMVSGWMEEDEDDKRTFGIIPDQMSLKERLSRYYYLYAPTRLPDVSKDAWTYRHDPEPLYIELKERYGKDPMDSECLVPPLPQPDPQSVEAYLRLITECFESIARELEQAEDATAGTRAGKTPATGADKAVPVSAEQQRPKSSAFDFPRAATQLEPVNAVASADTSIEAPPEESTDADLAASLAAVQITDANEETQEGWTDRDSLQWEAEQADTVESSKAALADWDAELARQSAANEPVHLSDDFRYWHWRELSISPVYEVTLLRWERQLQKDLGKSILSLIKSLSSSAAQKALQYTMLSAILAAVALPVFLLQLLDVIDNLWVLAIERADQAGRELAKALLERPQGRRPVTLVGYSMGCRVIFSCLKELARRLDLPPAPAGGDGDSADAAASDADADGSGDGETSDRGSEGNGGEMRQNSAEKDGAAVPAGSAAPAVKHTTTSGKLLAQAGALKRGVFSLGGKLISPVTSLGKPAAGTDRPAASEGGRGAEGNSLGSTGKQATPAATAMEAKDLKGLIGDVVLLGAPLDLRDRNWARIRALVSGRLINGYSRKDMVLAVIYRYQQIKIGVSGIAPVKVAGVENIDLTHIVTQHIHYCSKMKEILEEINLSSSMPYASPGHGSAAPSFGAYEA